MNSKPVVSVLDIGSSKVSLLVAELSKDSHKVIGQGYAFHKGVKRGAIVSISETIEAIKKVRREAELSSGYDVREVYVSFGGLTVKSFDSKGLAAVEGERVQDTDIQNALKTASAVLLPDDREIVHVLPQDYILDGLRGIQNPTGMCGVRLETNVHLITGARTAFPNIVECLESAGLKLKNFVLQAYASSLATLSEDEKELGACLIDIGGGTSEWIAYKNGVVIATGAVGVGGKNFSHDLAVGLRTSPDCAEQTKIQYGSCLQEDMGVTDTVEIEEVGEQGVRLVAKSKVTEILEPRVMETIQLIYEDIEKSGVCESLNAGLVFTGGASQLEGFIPCAKELLPKPVRMAKPHLTTATSETITDAEFSCAAGLLDFAYIQQKVRQQKTFAKPSKKIARKRKIVEGGASSSEEGFKLFSKQFKDFIGL